MKAADEPKPSREDWVEVFALLDVALELDPDARASWLAALGPEQARLLPLLQTLLNTHARAASDEFLQTPAAFVLAGGSGTATSPDAPADAARQSLVGPYRLLREIGQGGMATVWLAERADGLLQRQVALKLPHMSWGNSSLAARMARERNILASLTHPHIARLYDAGFTAEGRPYLALEYVDGQAIDAYAATHTLTVKARVTLILQVAQAVAHAHARLVVHRDLKPSNILVDTHGQAHLLDFGIARLLDLRPDATAADSDAGSALTLAVGRVLTPDYASPEQIRGETIGTASDVYSLGVVAYELLAGVRPYRLQSHGAGSLEAAVAALAVLDIPLASSVARAPGVRRALQGDLDAILNQALKQSVAERYPSVEAFAQDLERHLAKVPVRARPDTLTYRLRKLWQRQRLLLAAGVMVVLVLAAGLGSTLWQARLARAEGERAVAIKRFLVGLFDNSARQGSGGTPAFEVTGKQLLEVGTKRLLTDYKEATELRLELLTLLGSLNEELDLLQPAQRLLEEAARLALALHGKDDLRYAVAQLNLAESRVRAGDFDSALSHGSEALQLLQRQRSEPAEVLSQAQVLLGNVLYQLQRYDEARRQLEPALARLKANHTAGPQPARAAFYLARIHETQGRMADAEALYLEGIAAAEKDTGAQSYQAAFGYQNYGDLLRLLGRFAQAEHYLRRALAVYENVLGPRNLALSAVRFEIGRVLAAVGQGAEADRMYEQANALSDDIAGRFSANGSYQVAVRAELALSRGALASAGELFRSLLQHWPVGDGARKRIIHRVGLGLSRVLILEENLPPARALLDEVAVALAARAPDDPVAGPARATLIARRADVARAAGDAATARATVQAALHSLPPALPGELAGPLQLLAALARSAPPPAQARAALHIFAGLGDAEAFGRRDVESQALLDHTLGRLLLQAGEPGQARDRLLRALALRERIDLPTSPWLAETQLVLAESLLQLNERPAARVRLAQAQHILAAHPLAASLQAQARALQRALAAP